MPLMYLGSTPWGETCAQVGQPNYKEEAIIECTAFCGQILRQFGEPPEGAELRVMSFPHDFGAYWEVVIQYSDKYPEAVDYAYRVENNHPEKWDDEAREELRRARRSARRGDMLFDRDDLELLAERGNLSLDMLDELI